MATAVGLVQFVLVRLALCVRMLLARSSPLTLLLLMSTGQVVASAVDEILAFEALDLPCGLGDVYVVGEEHAAHAFVRRLGQEKEIVFRRVDDSHGRVVALCYVLADLNDRVLGLVVDG